MTASSSSSAHTTTSVSQVAPHGSSDALLIPDPPHSKSFQIWFQMCTRSSWDHFSRPSLHCGTVETGNRMNQLRKLRSPKMVHLVPVHVDQEIVNPLFSVSMRCRTCGSCRSLRDFGRCCPKPSSRRRGFHVEQCEGSFSAAHKLFLGFASVLKGSLQVGKLIGGCDATERPS